MIQTYDIPDDADHATLAALHNEILAHNPGIRVLNRWGTFSEYAVKIKLREVVELLGRVRSEAGDPEPADTTWRVVFGYDAGETVDLQYYDPGQRMWESALRHAEEGEGIIDAVTAWLRVRYPTYETLVTIDQRLL